MRNLADRPWRWMRSDSGDAQGRVRLSGRRIYILPTRYGVILAVLLLLMLIGAVNYNNQPAYLLTFILVGLAANAMYQTWRNLAGIQLECLPGEPVFAGQPLTLQLRLFSNDSRAHYAIQLLLGTAVAIDDMPTQHTGQLLTLTLDSHCRGPYRIDRLVVSTRYPFGLFNAWAYASPTCHTLVYPKPGDIGIAPSAVAVEGTGTQHAPDGNDDFVGLRDYRVGDSPQHIDWKRLAAERGVYTRQFANEVGTPVLLDWAGLGSLDVEWKLSQLTRAVLDAERAGLRYALALPGQQIAADQGETHLHACLRALACYTETDT